MELRHIYAIANGIRRGMETESCNASAMDDIEVTVAVSPTTHYGIDKEFYRRTHNGSTNGFEHSNEYIGVTIDGIKFNILNKATIKKQEMG